MVFSACWPASTAPSTPAEDQAAADRLVSVNKINSPSRCHIAYFNRVRAVDGVREVTHANWFGGYFQDPKNFIIVLAVEPATYMTLYGNEMDFDPEMRQAFVRSRRRAGGRDLGREVWLEGRDRIPIASNIFSQKSGGAHLGCQRRRHLQERSPAETPTS